MGRTHYVIYHPELGFLVDTCTGGAWSELRTDALVNTDLKGVGATIRAALDNGLAPEVAHATLTLPWVTP